MNVSNCRTCGRLFNALADERLCPACRRALDDKFQEVKAYLDEHMNATVEEVSRENEVSVKQIKQWIREERLTFAEGSLDGIECERCGKLIRTGRFCDECKSQVASNLMSAYDKPAQAAREPEKRESKNRMRFL